MLHFRERRIKTMSKLAKHGLEMIRGKMAGKRIPPIFQSTQSKKANQKIGLTA